MRSKPRHIHVTRRRLGWGILSTWLFTLCNYWGKLGSPVSRPGGEVSECFVAVHSAQPHPGPSASTGWLSSRKKPRTLCRASHQELGQTVLTSGKFEGKTFLDASADVKYVKFLSKRKLKDPQLQDFLAFALNGKDVKSEDVKENAGQDQEGSASPSEPEIESHSQGEESLTTSHVEPEVTSHSQEEEKQEEEKEPISHLEEENKAVVVEKEKEEDNEQISHLEEENKVVGGPSGDRQEEAASSVAEVDSASALLPSKWRDILSTIKKRSKKMVRSFKTRVGLF